MRNHGADARFVKTGLLVAGTLLVLALFPGFSGAQEFGGMLDGDPFAGLPALEVDSLDGFDDLGGDPFGSLSPLEDATLDASRGRAVLPDGLTVEATALMRVLVDGQELGQASVPEAGALSADPSALFPFAGNSAVFQNTLNGISLEHYREINFRISNIPIAIETGGFVPPPVIPSDVMP